MHRLNQVKYIMKNVSLDILNTHVSMIRKRNMLL